MGHISYQFRRNVYHQPICHRHTGRSAVNAGYLHDPYASLIAKAPSSSTTRRVPLINVGTHHRTWALDRLVDSFLESGDKGKPKQIVSLGAGSDTRFWRLMVSTESPDSPTSSARRHHAEIPLAYIVGTFSLQSRTNRPNISKYVEIDFDDVTSIKARRICMNKTLSAAITSPPPSSSESIPTKPQVSQGGSRLDTPLYTLLPLDLRIKTGTAEGKPPGSSMDETLSSLLDSDVPTLFLAECVYCYMQPEKSQRVIEWFAGTFGKRGGCVGVLYEMCGLE